MEPLPEKITRKALLALSQREWSLTTFYDSVYVVQTGKKHDSGYMMMAIIGVINTDAEPHAEVAAWCDDINWSFPVAHPYDRDGVHKSMLRTDCLYPSGILHMWASSESYFHGRFKVGTALSSTDVELIIERTGEPVRG